MLILALLILLTVNAYSQVSSPYLKDQFKTSNPALASRNNPKFVQFIKSSGDGERKSNNFKFYSYETEYSELTAQFESGDMGFQFYYELGNESNYNEDTESSNSKVKFEDSKMGLDISLDLSNEFSIGLGLENKKSESTGYEKSRLTLSTGASYSFAKFVFLGLEANIISDEGNIAETRRWIEYELGGGIKYPLWLFTLRGEVSMFKAPEVKQKTESLDDPNFQQKTSRSSLTAELLYPFWLIEVSGGYQKNSTSKEPFASGLETEIEETVLFLGVHTLKGRVSVQFSQHETEINYGKHKETIDSTQMGLSVRF